jgi:NADPH:quinone reductase-like Zn-dependent oxidoreductase
MTTTQRAVLLRAYGGVAAAEVAAIARPAAGQGQVLVRVCAAGVNGIDWKVREGLVQKAFPLRLPAVLGIELAGVAGADEGRRDRRHDLGRHLARTPPGRRGLWFVNKPDAAPLEQVAAQIAQGTLISKLGEVVGFDDIPAAMERNRTDRRIGKLVADFSR